MSIHVSTHLKLCLPVHRPYTTLSVCPLVCLFNGLCKQIRSVSQLATSRLKKERPPTVKKSELINKMRSKHWLRSKKWLQTRQNELVNLTFIVERKRKYQMSDNDGMSFSCIFHFLLIFGNLVYKLSMILPQKI